jgi:hypothetical protein
MRITNFRASDQIMKVISQYHLRTGKISISMSEEESEANMRLAHLTLKAVEYAWNVY